MFFSYKNTTAATSNPISNEEAQASLKTVIDAGDAEYTLIDTLTLAAVGMVEKITGLQLMPATWELTFKGFLEYIEINHPPVSAITSVKYYDAQNVLQTMASSKYQVNLYQMPALLRFLDMPAVYDRLDAITITYTSGYASADAVPASLKAAIFMILGHLFENRQTVSTMQTYEVPQAAEYLCAPYSIVKNPFDRALCT